jgi:hypothetical protein
MNPAVPPASNVWLIGFFFDFDEDILTSTKGNHGSKYDRCKLRRRLSSVCPKIMSRTVERSMEIFVRIQDEKKLLHKSES